MKHKEKRLEYAHQYQIMSTKEWWKVVFSEEKKFDLDGPDGFPKYWHTKDFPEDNYSTRHNGGGSLMILGVGFLPSGKLKLQFVSSQQKAADYVKMLNDLFSRTRRASSMLRRMDFSVKQCCYHNASITKKYLLKQKKDFLTTQHALQTSIL